MKLRDLFLAWTKRQRRFQLKKRNLNSEWLSYKMTHTTVSRLTVKAASTNYARIMLKTTQRDISMISSSKFNPEEDNFFNKAFFVLFCSYIFLSRSLLSSRFFDSDHLVKPYKLRFQKYLFYYFVFILFNLKKQTKCNFQDSLSNQAILRRFL